MILLQIEDPGHRNEHLVVAYLGIVGPAWPVVRRTGAAAGAGAVGPAIGAAGGTLWPAARLGPLGLVGPAEPAERVGSAGGGVLVSQRMGRRHCFSP